MEVRQRYKKTEVGTVPGEWDVSCLGAYGETYGGLTGKTKKDFGSGDAQYVTFMNVMSNVVIDCGKFERVYVGPSEPQNRVRPADLLFNGSSETPEEVALCAVVLEEVADLYLNSFCFGYRLQDRTSVDPLFVAYLFRSQTGRELVKALAQGSTRYNISKGALLRAPVALPPLPEQRAIATALSDVDALLDGLDRLIAKKRDLKQATIQQLLTGRTRLPGFSREWEGTTLASAVRHHAGNSLLIKGKLFSSEATGLFPAYSASGQDVWCDRFEYEGDAIVVSAVGSRCGKAFKASGKWSAIANTHVVWPDPRRVEFHYLAYVLDDEAFWHRSGTGQPFVLFNSTFTRRLHLPPIAEQTAIAVVLSDNDAELRALEARRNKTRALKQAMMQELLTGRTRLVPVGGADA